MKIVGFGACMISGTPYAISQGFLMRSCQILQAQGADESLEPVVVSLGGFPITRSLKYLVSKVLPLSPSLVVLQFGATDANIIFNKSNKKKVRAPKKLPEDIHKPRKASFKDQMSWLIKACIASILRLQPTTALADYLLVMDQLLATLRSHNCHCLILTPFRFGNFYSNTRAKVLRDHIMTRYAAMHGVDVIDCWGALAARPISEMVLADGIHITQEAHELIAHLLANRIKIHCERSEMVEKAGKVAIEA